jgi:hypothetical protein
MERVITFPDASPEWPIVRDKLAAAGVSVQMRMIDNMPAFPDEDPGPDWRELRVSLGGGMITLRRESRQMRVVVWGNADEATQRDQQTLANACAQAGDGTLS